MPATVSLPAGGDEVRRVRARALRLVEAGAPVGRPLGAAVAERLRLALVGVRQLQQPPRRPGQPLQQAAEAEARPAVTGLPGGRGSQVEMFTSSGHDTCSPAHVAHVVQASELHVLLLDHLQGDARHGGTCKFAAVCTGHYVAITHPPPEESSELLAPPCEEVRLSSLVCL